jgi:hypothetical protein
MTKSDENRLTARQIKALPHFSASLSIEEACKAAKAKWWPVYEILPLAFDHDEIYAKALEALRKRYNRMLCLVE